MLPAREAPSPAAARTAPEVRPRLAALLARIAPPYLVMLLFGGILAALLVAFHQRLVLRHGSVIASLAMMLCFALFSLVAHRRALLTGDAAARSAGLRQAR